ncbi:uncharacterized protein B0H64DRAFT_443575 [Chaetomium fimeti]|uniref:Putative gamma-glutamylcyclotransferase n=1 Tax=Chaetomium fimeti TaxID=1854472 RepID=A0AAE0HDS9_9PEZI|nr:hypothetical protein B0H64DRAFT_443575 [Chaetomium fimeti]
MPPNTTRPTASAQAQTSTGTSGKAGTAKSSTGTSGKAGTAKASTSTGTSGKAGTTKASTGTSSKAGNGASEASSSSCISVFVYGPLSIQEIFFKVCYGNKNPGPRTRNYHGFKSATIGGYQRLCVKNNELPGITPKPGLTTGGIVITGLTGPKLKKLDAFAGDRYVRRSVTANITKRLPNNMLADGENVAVQTYVFKNANDLEMFEEWDLEKFYRESRAKYTD